MIYILVYNNSFQTIAVQIFMEDDLTKILTS